MWHLISSNFYFLLLLIFNLPWLYGTPLPLDCCSLKCLKSERLPSISVFLMISAEEHVSVVNFWEAVRRLTGHPSEGRCATAQGREEADKHVLEDPRQGWSEISHSIAWLIRCHKAIAIANPLHVLVLCSPVFLLVGSELSIGTKQMNETQGPCPQGAHWHLPEGPATEGLVRSFLTATST